MAHYDVGQFVDLTYLNRKHLQNTKRAGGGKNTLTENLYSVGESFKFIIQDGQIKAARQILVVAY